MGEIDPGKCSNRMQDKDGKETCRTATLTDIGSQSSMEVQGDHNTDTVTMWARKLRSEEEVAVKLEEKGRKDKLTTSRALPKNLKRNRGSPFSSKWSSSTTFTGR